MKKLLSRQGAFMMLLGNIAHELWHFSRLPKARGDGPGVLHFCCNVCGRPGALELDRLEGERRECLGCGSTLRQRAIVATLSRKLFGGRSLAIDDWPDDVDVEVKGVSDAALLERALPSKLRYANTYFHQVPFLDIRNPSPSDIASCDILICSDVLEHVPPPVAGAFDGLLRIIRPGGFLLLTVPCTAAPATAEHFPELHDYRLVERGGERFLVNRTADGRLQEFGDLVFHGGPGETLEMREFSIHHLERALREAGFGRIEIHAAPDFRHGVYWSREYSVPVIATVPS